MSNNGFIFVWRKLRENPIYSNSKAIHIWIECLMRATYKERAFYQGREKVKLDPGQFVMGYREFSNKINIGASTVKYWMDRFEDVERMIERKTNAKGTIVTILNWSEYQEVERKVVQAQNVNRTTIESNNKEKKVKKDNNIPYSKIVNYLNKKADRQFKSTTPATKRKIKARWNEGFDFDDFKNVIGTKVAEWKDDEEMELYLRPKTLFGTKFEGYLNQPMPGSKPKKSRRPQTNMTEEEREYLGVGDDN